MSVVSCLKLFITTECTRRGAEKSTTYCKADCANLWDLAEILYTRRWAKVHGAFAKPVDFARTKGQQLSIFG